MERKKEGEVARTGMFWMSGSCSYREHQRLFNEGEVG